MDGNASVAILRAAAGYRHAKYRAGAAAGQFAAFNRSTGRTANRDVVRVSCDPGDVIDHLAGGRVPRLAHHLYITARCAQRWQLRPQDELEIVAYVDANRTR